MQRIPYPFSTSLQAGFSRVTRCTLRHTGLSPLHGYDKLYQAKLQKKYEELTLLNSRNEELIKKLTIKMEKEEITILRMQFGMQSVEISKLKTSLQGTNKELLSKKTQFQNYKKSAEAKISQLSQMNKELSNQIKQIIVQLEKSEAVSKSKTQRIDELLEERLFHIFERDALHARNPEKLYLCEQIEAAVGLKIKYTKLLCFYDKLNTTNFHQYIDEKPNICCVIRTVSGHCLAGFSQQPFSKQNQAINRGILVSISNKKTYKCKEGFKAVNYEQYFIMFGNSEIRIKTGSNELFSSFGQASGCYCSLGDKVSDLIGECLNGKTNIVNYEFFQVVFA